MNFCKKIKFIEPSLKAQNTCTIFYKSINWNECRGKFDSNDQYLTSILKETLKRFIYYAGKS